MRHIGDLVKDPSGHHKGVGIVISITRDKHEHSQDTLCIYWSHVEAFMWRASMKIGDLVVTKWECLSGIWVIVGGQGVMATKKYLVQNVATGELCTLHYTNLQPLEAK